MVWKRQDDWIGRFFRDVTLPNAHGCRSYIISDNRKNKYYQLIDNIHYFFREPDCSSWYYNVVHALKFILQVRK